MEISTPSSYTLVSFEEIVPEDFAKAGETVRKIISSVREGTFDYAARPEEKRDWGAYDEAQIHELVDLLEFIRTLVDMAEGRVRERQGRKRRGRGRPPTPAADVTKVLLLQTYLGVPNRVAQGLLLLFRPQLGISREFSYKVIERGYDRKSVNELLDEVVALTNEPVRGLEKVFGPDGTGHPGTVRGNYAAVRARQDGGSREAGGWPSEGRDGGGVFGAGVVGARFKLFTGWQGSANVHVGELSHFPALMARTKELHPEMEMVVGDGLYAGRWMCGLVASLGAVPRFLPRRNVTMKREGVKAWMDMLLALSKGPQGWMRDYHLRSSQETANFMMKNRKGKLRKRLAPRKETEAYLRVVQHNVRWLAALRYWTELRAAWIPWGS